MSDLGFDFRPYSLTEAIVSVRRLNELIDNLYETEKQLSDLQEKYDRAVEVIKEKSSIIDDIAREFNQSKLQDMILNNDDIRLRLHKFIQKTDTCWNWTGSTNGRGYGQISIKNKPYLSHRVMSAFAFKDFYDFYTVDHKCMNRLCVNPEHLRLVGSRINCIENSNSVAARHLKNTHCKNGHELVGENVRIRMDKGSMVRICKACVSSQRLARIAKGKKS